jgi:hypothetical protein
MFYQNNTDPIVGIVTALTTTLADVSAGKTANTHMYAKSVAGGILRDCADNHIKPHR